MNSKSKCVPPLVPILERLLNGEFLHHQTITEENNGQGHRLSLTISRLRHTYKLIKLIKCDRGGGQYKDHYYIKPSDRAEAKEIAINQGLI
jgi:hypothetical protein